jgi:D-sedoheptulose 7-phosphate isomerase
MGTINIGEYFNDLAKLFLEIQVTDKKGKEVNMTASLEDAIDMVESLRKENKKVMIIGNGGSAAIASHMAVDFWKNGGIKATAFNDSSLLTCIGNDYGYPFVFSKPIEMFADKGDVLIAISSSGRSENILNGVKAAEVKGCRIITMSGFKSDNPLRSMGEINFYVPSISYGYVELTHNTICHCIADVIVENKKT